MNANVDFWGFDRKYQDLIDSDLRNVNSEEELLAFKRRWLDAREGQIIRLKNEPFMTHAPESSRNELIQGLANHVHECAHEWCFNESLFSTLEESQQS